MTFTLSTKTKKTLKGLAYYQLAGGLIGLIVIIWNATGIQTFQPTLILIYALAIIAFGFSGFCGQRILKGELNKALKLSTVNQFLQIPSFFVLGFALRYAAGLFVSVGFDYTDDFNFTLHFGLSQLDLSFHSSSNQVLLELNLVAIYFLYLIGKLKKSVDTQLALFNSLLPDANSENILTTTQEIYLEDK